MTPLHRFLPLLVVLASAPLLSAQVTITATATATSTSLGYTAGTPYTFIFTTGASFANNTNSVFSSVMHRYKEDDTSTDNQLWSTLSGTGLSGSYVRPVGHPQDPTSILGVLVSGGNYFQAQAAADGNVTSIIGSQTLNGTPINNIYLQVDGGNLPNFLLPQAYVSPSSYFATYNGTYSGFSNEVLYFYTNSTVYTEFTVTSVTISAIPEPSTYATFAGVAALGLTAWRRRRLAA